MNQEQWDQIMRNDGVANMAGGSRQDYVDPPLDPIEANKRKRRSWTQDMTSYLITCVSEVVGEKGSMVTHLSAPTNIQRGNKDLTKCWTQVVDRMNFKYPLENYLVGQVKEHYRK